MTDEVKLPAPPDDDGEIELEQLKIKLAGQAVNVILSLFTVYVLTELVGQVTGRFRIQPDEWLINIFSAVFSGAAGILGIAWITRKRKG